MIKPTRTLSSALMLLLAGAGAGAGAATPGCAPAPGPLRASAPVRIGPAAPGAPAASTSSGSGSGAGWSYEVVASPRGETLAVDAVFPAGTGGQFTVEDGAEPFVKDVTLHDGERTTSIAPSGERWTIPKCATGCRISYRFALADAARANRERSVAQMHGEAVEAPPSSWLLRPLDAANGIRFRFHVTSAPGDAFATGVFPVQGLEDTYEGHTVEGFDLPYAAFGRIRRLQLANGHVEAAMFPGTFTDEPAVVAWIERSAKAVETFYGSFPIRRVLVLVQPSSGRRVGFGTTMGSSGAAIEVPVGEGVTPAQLRDDWMLVHEMVHTALPDLTRKHHWLEEGLATYLEPLARVQAGITVPEQVWKEWILGMPQGEPAAGDEGLDRTHTWGRTYWGGALFCLEVDVAIRERTGGRKSLVDVVRAIVAQGGNISVGWPIERVIEVGDAVTGVPVLRETYARMATKPGAVDLSAIWTKLGVRLERGTITYDDKAPLAAIRRSMTEPRK
jgi:predicted metalloprotease with PDZ domain